MRLSKRSMAVTLLVLGAVLGQGACAQSMDLLQAWRLAEQQDPEHRAAYAAARAGATQAQQARSLWLPGLDASATAGRGGHKSSMQGANFTAPGFGTTNGVEFNNSITGGDLEAYDLNLHQPIINRELLAQSRQLRLSAQQAELRWQHARQQLILRVTGHYFDVLLTRQTARLLEQQYQQSRRLREEVQARFRLGDLPVTDSHEAAAQSGTLEARLLEARLQQQLAEAAFFDLTGQPPEGLLEISPECELEPPELAPLNDWLAQAMQFNPAVLMQEQGVRIAEEEIMAYSSWRSPTLSLVGRLSHDKLDGSGRYGHSMRKADDWMLGVQLRVPVFTGGYRSAKRKEAIYLHEQQQADTQAMRQQVQQQVRSTWHALAISTQQIAALQEALLASRLRAEATALGKRLGDKTTLEALDADSQMTEVQIQLLNARLGLIMHQLQLAALVGALNEQHLRVANSYLQ